MLVNYNYEDLIEVYVNPDLWIGTTDNGDVNQDIRFGRNYLFSKIFVSDLANDIGLTQPVDLLIKDHISSEKINKLTYALDYSGKGIAEGLEVHQVNNYKIQVTKGIAVIDNCVIKVKYDVELDINNYENQDYLHTGRYYLVLRYKFDRNNVNNTAYFDLISKKEFETNLYEYNPTILSLGLLYIIKEAKETLTLSNAYSREKNLLDNSCRLILDDIVYIYSSYGRHGYIYPNDYVPVIRTTTIPTYNLLYNGSFTFNGSNYFQSIYNNCGDIINNYPETHFDGTIQFSGNNKFDGVRIGCDFPNQPLTSVTFTILPEESYRIHELYIDNIIETPVSYYTFNNINGTRTIYANFEPIDLYIMASSIGPGGIDPSGVVKVKWGSDVTFTIEKDTTIDTEKAYLKQLIIDGESIPIVNEYRFEHITESHTILAIFDSYDDRNYYTVKIDCNGTNKGSVIPYGEFKVPEYSSLYLNITSNDGYYIKDLVINGYKVPVNSRNHSYRINSIVKNYNIFVEYEEIDNEWYTVSLLYDNNQVEITTNLEIDENNQIKQLKHKEVKINIKPKSELYCIDDVIWNGISLGRITEIYISYSNIDNHSLEVISSVNKSVNEIKEFTIKVQHNEGGKVYPDTERTYPEHTTVTYYFDPDPQYEISDIKINGTSFGKLSSYTFTDIKQNYQLEVQFKRSKRVVTIESNEGGKIDPYGDIEVYSGEDLLINIDPLEGYYIKEIISNNNRIPPQNQYVLRNIQENQYVYIYFDKKHYIIHINTKGKGSIYPNQNVIIEHGKSIEFKFTPQAGYRVKSVYVDGLDKGNLQSYKFNYVSKDHSLVVEFEPDVYEIDINYSDGGVVSPSGKILVATGSRQKINIYPNDNYIIDVVQIDDQSLTNINTYEFVNVKENHKVYVTFKKKPQNYKVTIVANHGGIVDPIGVIDVPENGSVGINIKANSGFIISKIIDNNTEQSFNNNTQYRYNLTNVNEDHTVNIIFTSQ